MLYPATSISPSTSPPVSPASCRFGNSNFFSHPALATMQKSNGVVTAPFSIDSILSSNPVVGLNLSTATDPSLNMMSLCQSRSSSKTRSSSEIPSLVSKLQCSSTPARPDLTATSPIPAHLAETETNVSLSPDYAEHLRVFSMDNLSKTATEPTSRDEANVSGEQIEFAHHKQKYQQSATLGG